jgi:phosphatidylglycerol:prolipoprotein diacylglycerol transferase
VLVHTLFDVLALVAAAIVFWRLPLPAAGGTKPPWQAHRHYLALASLGATAGAYLAGSLNLWLSGVYGVGRSIEGGIAGAIVAVECLKYRSGVRGSTGVRLAAPLAAAIAVGRIGCFQAGLDDMTYGTPTTLPWGVDFGDGVPRHPVQLYESVTMAAFLVAFIAAARRESPWVMRTGFYLFVGVYGVQRFLWEFLKPYATVAGPLNLFHLLSIALAAYAILFAFREMRRPCPLPLPQKV